MLKRMLTALGQGLLMAAVVFAVTAAHAKNPEEEAEKAADKAKRIERYKLYTKLGGGYNHANKLGYETQTAEFVDGYGLQAAIGYKLKRWRVEGELVYRYNEVEFIKNANGTYVGTPGGQLTTTAMMLNGYYDLPTSTGIKPYIGIGIGLAQSEAEFKDGPATIQSHDGSSFAYQGILGSNFNISDTFALFAEYKYFGAPEIDIDPLGSPGEYENHSVMFGIKYNFN